MTTSDAPPIAGLVPLENHVQKWLCLLLAVVPIIVAVTLSTFIFSRGTAGFQIEKTQNCFVVSRVNRDLNPVRTGDRITHVGGLAYHEILGSLLTGKTTPDPSEQMTLQRDGRTITLQIRFAPLKPLTFIKSTGPYFLFILLSLALCISALHWAPAGQPVTLFILTLSSFALLFVCQFPIQFGILYPRLQSAATLTTTMANWIGFSAWLHFALRFPVERQMWQDKPLRIAAVIYLLPPVAAICLALIYSGAGVEFFGWLQRMRRWAVPLIIVAVVAKQWHDLRCTTSTLVRNQLRLIVTGSVSGISVYLCLYLIPNMIIDQPLIPFYVVALCSVLIPLSFFLALIHFRLLDVDRMITWTISHMILIGGLMAAYTMAAPVFKRLMQGQGISTESLFVFYILLVSLFFAPVRSWVGRGIDVLFFRHIVDFQKVLHEFSTQVVTAIKMTDLTQAVTRQLPAAFHLSQAVLVIFAKERIRVYPEEHPHLAMFKALQTIPEMIGRGCTYLLTDLNSPGAVEKETDLLRRADIHLILRLQSGTTFIGMLLLGAKQHHAIYSGREIQTLTILANQLATAVENALTYQSLESSQTALKTMFARMVHAEKLATIGEMTAVLAHEIKNPLGVIRSSAQYLAAEQQPPDERDELLNFIVDEVDRLTQVVNNLLGLARFAPPSFKPVKVFDLLSSLIVRWEKSEDHNARVTIRCRCRESEPILADPQQLAQVFMNLIRNSEDAMPDGGRIDIALDSDPPNDGIMITLKDSGPGVAPEQAEKLWQNFYTTKKDGVGLGLPVCRQIIQAHDGTIEIETARNSGFCIVICLPFRPEFVVPGTVDPKIKSNGSP